MEKTFHYKSEGNIKVLKFNAFLKGKYVNNDFTITVFFLISPVPQKSSIAL